MKHRYFANSFRPIFSTRLLAPSPTDSSNAAGLDPTKRKRYVWAGDSQASAIFSEMVSKEVVNLKVRKC